MKVARSIFHLVIFLSVLSVLTPLVGAAPAHAASGIVFVVTSTVDTASDNKCSLPEAITAETPRPPQH